MPTRRHVRPAVVATAALVTALSAVTSTAATAPTTHRPRTSETRTGASEARGSFDLRTAGGTPAQGRRMKTVARASRVPATRALSRGTDGALLDIDPTTGTPRMLARLDGYLTGPSDGKPARIAMRFVRDNLAALGLERSDLDHFEFRDDYRDITGTHHLSWNEVYRRHKIFGYGLQAAVTKDGRLLMLGGSPVPIALLSSAHAPSAITSPSQAISSARRVGHERSTAPGRRDSAEQVLFVTRQQTYLGWETTTMSADQPALTVQDAASGRLLYRKSLGDSEHTEPITGRSLRGGSASTGVAFRGYTIDPYHKVNFTKLGWLKAGATKLSGNNSHAYSDVNDDNTPQQTEEVGPKSGHRWNYKVKAFDLPGIVGANAYCGKPFPCTWNPDKPYSWRANRAQNTTQVFYFVNKWHDVLKHGPIGFTEDAGNFQKVNRTGKGKDGDAVDTNTLDGANTGTGKLKGLPDGNHVDNANMSTPADGRAPTMQMYLQHVPFTAYSMDGDPFPPNNTGDEADTIYHEYTHGLSHRLVIDPNGHASLGPVQGDAMGEAWSDFYALAYLVKKGLREDQPGTADLWLGHADGLGIPLLRSEPIDCQVHDPASQCSGGSTGHSGGYTYADYAKVAGGPEVHADGEIWGQTLWDLKQAIGYKKTLMLVTRAMELAPYDPSMLDERNAILIADTSVYDGANHETIWDVFAQRGMGFYAGALGGGDAQPGASYDTPPVTDNTGTISGTVTDSATHEPIAGVPVTLAFQGADSLTNPTTVTDANGDYELGPVPTGTYPKLVVNGSGGYVPVTAEVNVTPGGTDKDFAVVRDWAAESGGAAATDFNGPDYSPSCGPADAIDLSQATGWGSTTGTDGSPTNVFVPKHITVRLPQAIDVDSFGVDPSATCGDGGSASTGAYKIETSPNGTSGSWTQAASGTFTEADRGRINTVNPTGGATGVRYVRFTILGNQTPDFATNCPDGPYSGCSYTDLTELEVFGAPAP